MTKLWKTIEIKNYKNVAQCIKELKREKVYVSVWIDDIVKNNKNKIKITNKKMDLYRIKVSSLGFSKPTTLQKIYKEFKKKKV